MKTRGERFPSGASLALLGLLGYSLGIVTAPAQDVTPRLAEAADDPGPTVGVVELASFGPSLKGPEWTAVTYTSNGRACFDLVAAWRGVTRGSFGGCGFEPGVERTLALLASGSTVSADFPQPVVLAEGYVASGAGRSVYGGVAGIVGCDCRLVAEWSDGTSVSTRARNGYFLAERTADGAPTEAGSAIDHQSPPSVVSVSVAGE